jgi:hypothetical protein
MSENTTPQSRRIEDQFQALVRKLKEPRKLKKSIVVCAQIFGFFWLLGVVTDLAGCNKTDPAPQRLLQQMADSPLANRIRGLNAGSANYAGIQDGARDSVAVATRTPPGADMDRELREFRDAKMGVLELIASQAKFDPTVFAEYQRGWYDGFNSLERVR